MFELNVTEAVVNGARVSRERRDARTSRMIQHWADRPTVFSVGNILASKFDAKRTLADVIAAGESVPMDSITIKGIKYPLTVDFALSLATIGTWGCPACHSAHGTGVGSSGNGGIQVNLLAANKFYYCPETSELFTISATCFQSWVVGLDAVKSRFVPAPSQSTAPSTTAPSATAKRK